MRLKIGLVMVVAGLLTAVGAAPAVAAPSTPDGPAARPTAGFAYWIQVDRSGGIAGRHDVFTVGWFTPNRPGWTALALASTPRFRWLKPSYLPADQCCDRFSYVVTVRYQRGPTKVVRTMDGAPAPAVLWQVIKLTQRGGLHTSPTP
jgi:hypothetical protein